MYQVGTAGPTGTGDGTVPAESPQPREGFLSVALRDGCGTLRLKACFLGREKGAVLVEMNSSSKRGCAQLRKSLQALTQWLPPADAAQQRAHGDQNRAGFTPGTYTLVGTFWAKDWLGWEGLSENDGTQSSCYRHSSTPSQKTAEPAFL